MDESGIMDWRYYEFDISSQVQHEAQVLAGVTRHLVGKVGSGVRRITLANCHSLTNSLVSLSPQPELIKDSVLFWISGRLQYYFIHKSADVRLYVSQAGIELVYPSENW